MSPAIELIAINKRFGDVHANRDVSFRVERGTIHGIVGENGAGKSTLMSILYGFYEADSGEVRVNGRPIAIRSPNDAISAGIGMVHQHFMLVEPLTVVENVMLGAEGGAMLRVGEAKVRAELARLARDYGLALLLERPEQIEQRVRLRRRQHGGGLVENENFRTAIERLEDLDSLLQPHREVADGGVHIDCEAVIPCEQRQLG
ncbi:MAG TPA: ATP-binding cassette domain-containing protein, partial [Microvirga sp.]|nr:ATP-binding cassette domain-containing protein [Microvirga sp.]